MNKLDLIRAYAPQLRTLVSPEQALTMYAPGAPIRNKYTLCIAHQEKTASMYVGPKYAHCFGCGFHGDCIEIVKHLLGLDTHQAMLRLNDDFALCLPLGRKLTVRESMEAKERADQAVQQRSELHDDRIARLEKKLDNQQLLFSMQDLAKQFRPTDPDAPANPLFGYALKQIEQLQYLLDVEA